MLAQILINIIGAALIAIGIAVISVGYALSYVNHYMYEHIEDIQDLNITKDKNATQTAKAY